MRGFVVISTNFSLEGGFGGKVKRVAPGVGSVFSIFSRLCGWCSSTTVQAEARRGCDCGLNLKGKKSIAINGKKNGSQSNILLESQTGGRGHFQPPKYNKHCHYMQLWLVLCF